MRVLLTAGCLAGCSILVGADRVVGVPARDGSAVAAALSGIHADWMSRVVQVTAYRPVGPPAGTQADTNPVIRLEPTRVTVWATGIVVDSDGLVLTCAEAAQPGDSLELQRADGERIGAVFLAQDVQLGVALLRADDPTGLIPAEAGPSDEAKSGDWLFVVSYGAGGRQPGLRVGCLDSVPTNSRARHFLVRLADCHGACGSAVVDSRGRLQGMLVDLRTERDTELQGGRSRRSTDPLECDWVRAIQAVELDDIVAALLVRSEIPIGFLGVSCDIDSGAAGAGGRSEHSRARALRVAWVMPGSPADAAGIRPDDEITAIDGIPVYDFAQVTQRITGSSPGTEVRIRVLRNGVPMDVTTRLVERSALEWKDREQQMNQLLERRLRTTIQVLERRLKSLEQERARYQPQP